MMLGYGVALKGCATRPGKPASALDRDAVAKQVAVIPFMAECASAAELRLIRAPSCEDVIMREMAGKGRGSAVI